MNKLIFILTIGIFQLNCNQNNSETDNGIYGLDNYERFYDFSDAVQLSDLPSHGKDLSYIENEKLKCPIPRNEHKGLGRKFYFDNNSAEPNEAQIEFTIWIDSNFQKGGVLDESGKLPGFEGIYDLTAGWGGRQVTNQPSWSLRIGHGGENKEGKMTIVSLCLSSQNEG